MAETSLRDKILSEILSPALKVADDVFSDDSTRAFATYQKSTFAYLLVNKAWLRVSTPLLYHTVVLPSKAQAVALADALINNNNFGRFVKRLRVEGGFGPSIKKVLALTPNVTDLFLSLDMYSSDSVGGLCSGLRLISPSRLILMRDAYNTNKMYRALVDAVVAAIPGWDRLTFLHSPFWALCDAQELLNAIAGANRLQHLVVPSMDTAVWTYAMVKTCPLRVVEIRDANPVPAAESNDPALSLLLKFRSATMRRRSLLRLSSPQP
ncbi:F-box domain-containing protein [Mycena kentingensis (nom. inval.)]|nr:F-box domain-containing protein [Mycena kentingensis (nom. inval.)]